MSSSSSLNTPPMQPPPPPLNQQPSNQTPALPATQQQQQQQPQQQHPIQPIQPRLEKLPPGTELYVGKHKTTIVKYLSEGGFAHIYVVKIHPEEYGSDIACLKRVIVPNKDGLNQLRAEVEVMQKLSNCDNIVKYYDSNASRIPNTTCYEVLVLMELCPNKSLLDYMNSRLSTKLTELEILKIMSDISKAIYSMHKLKLIHRDIKIENVLIDSNYKFKLADFGSTCPILRVPKNQQEFQVLHNDLLHQTTPQYRSPEMVDLYRGLPIDEKSDIWALGIFLYKLCYYTTPFESAGELAILHSAYKFPNLPKFSKTLKNLINLLLQENPNFRPNIYQVILEITKMLSGDYDVSQLQKAGIEDIYGSGAYTYPSVDSIHPSIEPFGASLIPMYSPFKSTPQDPIELQQQHQQQQQQQQQSLQVTSSSVLNIPGSPMVSRQNTQDSSHSYNLDHAEERFPDLDQPQSLPKQQPPKILNKPNIVIDQHIRPQQDQYPQVAVDPRKKWSSNNPFPSSSSGNNLIPNSIQQQLSGNSIQQQLSGNYTSNNNISNPLIELSPVAPQHSSNQLLARPQQQVISQPSSPNYGSVNLLDDMTNLSLLSTNSNAQSLSRDASLKYRKNNPFPLPGPTSPLAQNMSALNNSNLNTADLPSQSQISLLNQPPSTTVTGVTGITGAGGQSTVQKRTTSINSVNSFDRPSMNLVNIAPNPPTANNPTNPLTGSSGGINVGGLYPMSNKKYSLSTDQLREEVVDFSDDDANNGDGKKVKKRGNNYPERGGEFDDQVI